MSPVIIGNATLHMGDCMDYMRGLEDKAFDLAIVDPPYGIGMDGGVKYKRGKEGVCKANEYKPFGDKFSPDDDYFIELFRVSKNQIIWGANYFIDKMAKASSCWIVWDKVTGEYTAADSELAWTSFSTAVRNFRFQWSGMLQGDMKNKESRIHPTQKPVKLYEWLLTNYAKPGQRILDTHLGSGSSAIAANNLGFEFVGCELDADYFSAACQRIENAQRQESLFDVRDAYEQPQQQADMWDAA